MADVLPSPTPRLVPFQTLHDTSQARVLANRTLRRLSGWSRRWARTWTWDVFHAITSTDGGYHLAFRRTDLIRRSRIIARPLDASYRPQGPERDLGEGEDPRLVVLNGRTLVHGYVFDWDGGSEDTRPFLADFETGTRTPLSIRDGTFRGKNWVPFVREGALYFLHALDPLNVLRCDTESGVCDWVFREDPKRNAQFRFRDDYRVLGRRRGGTQGVWIDDRTLFGFGHETAYGGTDKSHHVPFLWLLDVERFALKAVYPDTIPPRGCHDPSSVHVEGDDVVVVLTDAPGQWIRPQRFRSRLHRWRGGRAAIARHARDLARVPSAASEAIS